MSRIILEEQASPSPPSANQVAVYPLAGGRLAYKNDVSTEYIVGNQDSAFLAWRLAAASTQNMTNGVYTLINISTEQVDFGGYYEHTSTFKYTPPAGVYHMGGHVYALASIGDQQQMALGLFKNGNIVALLDTDFASGANVFNLSGSVVVEANGTDYFDLRLYHSTGGDKNLAASSNDHIAFWGYPIITTNG